MQDADTPLHAAAGSGRSAVVRLLLDAGADIEARNKVSSRATAATLPHLRVTPRLHTRDHSAQVGDTPLSLTAWFLHPGACRVLLDAGADVLTKDVSARVAPAAQMAARTPSPTPRPP